MSDDVRAAVADQLGADRPMLLQLPRSEYPLTVDVAEEMGDYGSDAHYEFVLDGLLSGLRATAGSS